MINPFQLRRIKPMHSNTKIENQTINRSSPKHINRITINNRRRKKQMRVTDTPRTRFIHSMIHRRFSLGTDSRRVRRAAAVVASRVSGEPIALAIRVGTAQSTSSSRVSGIAHAHSIFTGTAQSTLSSLTLSTLGMDFAIKTLTLEMTH